MALLNRIIILLLLLAVIAAVVIAAVELVLAGLDQPALLVRPGEAEEVVRRATWQDPAVRIATGVAGLVGLLLVVAQLKPRRPDTVESRPIDAGRQIVLDRHGMEAEIDRRVVADHDVLAAHVRWRRFRLRVRCDLYADADRGAAADRVERLVKDELDRQDVRRPPHVRVSTRRSEARAR